MSAYNEPWRISQDYQLLDKKNNFINTSNCPRDLLSRIVACVNACDGIPLEDLQSHWNPFSDKQPESGAE